MSQFDQPDVFFLFCEEHGIRLSTKTKILLRVFCALSDGIDLEELWLLLKRDQLQISRASVSRIMRWLCSQGYAVQQKDELSKRQMYRANLPC